MNSMWGMLLSMVLLALPIGLWCFLRFTVDVSGVMRILGVAALLLLQAVACGLLLHRFGVRCYARSEG